MSVAADPIVTHYARSDLMDRIRSALRAAGHDPDRPSVEVLRELDHLHGGGFRTTVVQADVAGIPQGSHVLDAGCGIGGPSRYLAHALGCTVEAIDLTPEYVDVADRLNALVGLQDRIRTVVGSVTDLPYPENSFDVVLCQNVSMNVPNKALMFSEACRVLRGGGIYTLSHVAEGPHGDPVYPLPWARRPEESHLGEPGELIEALEAAGFRDVRDRMVNANADPGGAPAKGTIGPAPAMGDDMPERLANVVRSMEEGRLVSMLVVARKP
jgi:SAM-dependent methyltransferase